MGETKMNKLQKIVCYAVVGATLLGLGYTAGRKSEERKHMNDGLALQIENKYNSQAPCYIEAYMKDSITSLEATFGEKKVVIRGIENMFFENTPEALSKKAYSNAVDRNVTSEDYKICLNDMREKIEEKIGLDNSDSYDRKGKIPLVRLPIDVELINAKQLNTGYRWNDFNLLKIRPSNK